MKLTPLYEWHAKHANMGPYGGYLTPVWYKGITEEHNAVRNDAGIFDITHMGKFWFKGRDAKEFLSYISVSNLENLTEGKGKYTVILNERGGIMDEAVIYKVQENFYLMICDAVAYEKLEKWYHDVKSAKFANADVAIMNKTHELVFIAIQGPNAYNQLEWLGFNKEGVKRFSIKPFKYEGRDIIFSLTGYTGEKGFELLFERDGKFEFEIWQKFIDNGVQPCGLAARNTLRIEAGFTLYEDETFEGRGEDPEIDESTPLQTNFEFMIDWNKDFVGKQALLKQKERGIKRKIYGIEMIDNAVPREKYEVCKGDKNVGYTTCGTLSPYTGKKIGLAFLEVEAAESGEVEVMVRNKKYRAKIVKPPFYTKKE